MPMVSELILKVHIKSLICRNLYQCLDTVILSFFSVLVSQMQALYPPPSSFFLASPGSTWTSWRMRGRLVTTPVPLGSKSLPTRLSSTELFPLLCWQRTYIQWVQWQSRGWFLDPHHNGPEMEPTRSKHSCVFHKNLSGLAYGGQYVWGSENSNDWKLYQNRNHCWCRCTLC